MTVHHYSPISAWVSPATHQTVLRHVVLERTIVALLNCVAHIALDQAMTSRHQNLCRLVYLHAHHTFALQTRLLCQRMHVIHDHLSSWQSLVYYRCHQQNRINKLHLNEKFQY